jgi:hypothetical protein
MIYFDEMDWSVILDYSKVDLNESLEVISLMRRVNYNLLSRLSAEDFNKEGVHSTRGNVTLDNLVESYIEHVNTHLNQIKKNLSVFENKA